MCLRYVYVFFIELATKKWYNFLKLNFVCHLYIHFPLFFSGTLLLVVLGVVVLAVVVSIMVVNWAKLIFEEDISNVMVLIVLITANSSGVLGLFSLACYRFYEWYRANPETERVLRKPNVKEITFLKVKRFSMVVFGLCYIMHCVFYAWEHSTGSSLYHQLGLA